MMYFNMNDDLKDAIECGLVACMGANEIVVLMVLQAQMKTPVDPVTISTQDISKYTGLGMGSVVRAIKNLELKGALKRDKKNDIGTMTFYVTTEESVRKRLSENAKI